MSDLADDSLNQPIVDYADVADLYELCACRKEQTMRVCRSHEALRRERDTLRCQSPITAVVSIRDGGIHLAGVSHADSLRLLNVASSLMIHQSHITPVCFWGQP